MIFAFICGIAVSYNLADESITILKILCAAFFIISILFYFTKRAMSLFKVFLAISIFFGGAAYLKTRTDMTISTDNIVNFADNEKHTIRGIVTEAITYSDKGDKRFIVNVKRVTSDGYVKEASGRMSVRTENIASKIEYGDLIRFNTRIRKPNNFKNPGAFDYVSYLRSRGIYATGNVYRDKQIASIIKGHKKGALYYINKLKERVNDFIYSRGISVNKHIVSALLFGNSSQINKYARELFEKTGTSHILAISGLHMGVISLFFYFTTIFLLSRSERLTLEFNIIKLSYLITLILLIFYSFLVGMRVSTVRSVIMIGIYILSVLFDKSQNMLRTMCVAAFFILLFYPASLYEVSFILSFSAVFAILYFFNKINLKFDIFLEKSSTSYFKKRKYSLSNAFRFFLVFFVLSFIINLIIFPIILYHFNYVSLSAPIINAVIIPIFSVIVIPLNFVIFFFSLIFPAAGELLLHLNEYIIHLVIVLLKFFNRNINISFYFATPTLIEIVLYYGLIFSIFKIKENKFKITALACAALLVLSVTYYKYKPFKNDSLTIDFIDVSQGESIFIRFPNGKNMLVDGGGFYSKSSSFDIGKDVVAKYLWKEKISKIDYIVSTHPHPDHMIGLFFIAKNFKPDRIFMGKYDYDKKLYVSFVKKFREKIEYIDEKNKTISIGGAKVDFLNYDYNGPVKTNVDVNRSCIVVRLDYKGKRVLLTGDIDAKIEDDLIDKGIDLKSDILKIGHHGSKDSTTVRFLKEASPKYAVISVGYMNFLHLPSIDIINLLNDSGVKVYRTDMDGMITAKINDDNIIMDTYVK